MYEPVSDQCDTIINPKYANRDAFQYVDEEYMNNELMPPKKPPRKNKLNKQSKQESNEETRGCNNKMKGGNGETFVDVDHINLEVNNYKNKHANASVQTSPFVPYRLRFWPRSSCDLKCDPGEDSCTRLRLTCCCRVVSQWVLSQVGLTLIVIIWALLGALAFYKTEGPRELEKSKELAKYQNVLSIKLANKLRQAEENKTWESVIDQFLQEHEIHLLEEVSDGFGEGGGGSIWTYPGCILFAVSLLTTLGFGAPVPRTSLGRGSAVLFSAIGIPLHFLLILNMGNLGAVKLQRLAFYGSSSTDVPTSPRPKWLRWFPFASIAFYYCMGVLLFGYVREEGVVDSFMFPLGFTAAGGVATTYGHTRILYALYLEFAVSLAALVLSLIQASATRGIVDIALRLGLLTNT